MAHSSMKKEKTFIEINTSELSSAQIRSIKTLNVLLEHVLTADNEGEYFDGSAEVMRLCASLIKQASFIQNAKMVNIPYAEQALEFSVDVLQDHIATMKVVNYDN